LASLDKGKESEMRTLYFMRHGESEFNKANEWSESTTNSPLTKKGLEQSQRAGQELKESGVIFDVIISSPLTRAFQTAEQVAKALDYPAKKIHINDRLVERSFGSLEGKKALVATTKYIVDESAIDSYDDVETLADFQARVDDFLKYLQTLPYDNILIVGHGAFGRALRRAVNKDPITKRGKVFGNAEIERFI
jgi:broad specificity phosphatase PhoE